jgi:hypothetical protein
MEGRARNVVHKLAIGSPPKKEKAALGGPGLFDQSGVFLVYYPPIIRIPNPALNRANYDWVIWRVSGVESCIITSVFSTHS